MILAVYLARVRSKWVRGGVGIRGTRRVERGRGDGREREQYLERNKVDQWESVGKVREEREGRMVGVASGS